MKNAAGQKTPLRRFNPPDPGKKSKEKEAFLASVRQLDEQCDSLGFLDPAGVEPAILYFAVEDER